MKLLIALCLAFTFIGAIAGCTHRAAPPLEQTAPAKAATSTPAQSAEIAPLVLTGVAVGGATVALAVGLGATGCVPTPIAKGGVAAGGTLAVGALTLQRFLPYIPWLIIAGLVCGIVWLAVKHFKLGKLAAKDRAKLQEVAARAGSLANQGHTLMSQMHQDLVEHLQ